MTLLGLTTGVAAADPCPDVNGDGILDNGDIGQFVAVFLARDPRGDFNGDGILDNGDIGAFISLYLAGAPCTPEVSFKDGQAVGTLTVAGDAPNAFLSEQWLAEPSVIEPLPGIQNNGTVFAVGTDTDGSRVIVGLINSLRQIVIDRETGGQEFIPLHGNGVTQPTLLNTLPTEDPVFMYEPVAARVHDGLVMVLCDTHWYRGDADPKLATSWDISNTISVLWKNLDDDAWNIIRDTQNPTFGRFGAPWAMGIPIIPEPGVLLVGWTNYQWKFEWNGPNQAFLSRFEKGTDGRWTHGVSLNMLEDGSAPANQHFHTLQPYWTGSQLRVFISVGDGIGYNGIYEIYRDDLDIASAATPKPGSVGVSLPDASWTDAGYINGGKAVGGFNRPGLQPTFMLPFQGRMYCGGDEAFPAIASFDPNRPGGTHIDDVVSAYLPHASDIDTGLGWLALTGDLDDYANPTRAVAMVQPSASWNGSRTAANRIVYFDGRAWASVANIEAANREGVGIGPGGTISVGADGAILQVHPGELTAYTPLASSPAATNSITDPGFGWQILGGQRATITDITDQPELVGPNPFAEGTRVLRVRVNTEPEWIGNPYARVLAPEGNRQTLVEGDSYQFHYWLRAVGDHTHRSRFVPIEAGTGAYLMTSPEGVALSMTSGSVSLAANDWTEFLDVGFVNEPIGPEPVGFGIRTQTQPFDGLPAVFDYDLAIQGLFVNSTDIVTLRPEFGASRPDTNQLITMDTLTLPVTVHGITSPLGASSGQATPADNRNLCTLWIDADNYLSLEASFAGDSIRYNGRLNGQLLLGTIVKLKWTRATPVSLRFENSGADLLVSASTYGGPWSDPVPFPGLGSADWQQFQLFGPAGQSHLGLASFKATPK